jgi:hypothetical protein
LQNRRPGRISLPPPKAHTLRRSDSVLLSQLPGVRGIHSSRRQAARRFDPRQAASDYNHNNYFAYPTMGNSLFSATPGRRSARRPVAPL